MTSKNKIHIRSAARTVTPQEDEVLFDCRTACHMPFRAEKPYLVTSDPAQVTCVKCHRLLDIRDYRLWKRVAWGWWTYFDYVIQQRHCAPGTAPAGLRNTTSYWEVMLDNRVIMTEAAFWQVQERLFRYHKRRLKIKDKPPTTGARP